MQTKDKTKKKKSISDLHKADLQKSLRESGLYQKIDDGAIEMLANLYEDFKNPELPLKEKRETIKLYVELIKQYGGTPTSRQKLKVKGREDADAEGDLKEFMED